VRLLAWLFPCALAACRAPLETTVVASPAGGFPRRIESPGLWVEASFVTNHAQVFGLDLTIHDCLPVAVRAGSIDPAGAELLDPQKEPRLYLGDGTELARVRPEQTGVRSLEILDRLRVLELPAGPLPAWEEAATRFLYFRLPEPVRVHRAHVLSSGGGVWRELSLGDSLLVLGTDRGDLGLGLSVVRWPGSWPPGAGSGGGGTR
jgi:hypothetical protein